MARKFRRLAAPGLLLVALAARAEVLPVDGPCRLKLRSGRILEAQALEAVGDGGAFWKIVLDGQNALVVPVREIKRAEILPATASAPDPPAGEPLAAGDASDGSSRCDPATDQRIRRWDRLLEESSSRHGLDVDLVRAIVAVESCGDPSAVSRKGAVGLMQILPRTASDYGCTNLKDPEANVETGCRHLARLKAKLGDIPLVLAAYNAGEGAVARHDGIPRYRETQAYVRNVLARHAKLLASPPAS